MSVHEMAERFYDLFFEGSEKLTLREYLDHSFCDEVGIIDFSTDNINIAYHVNGKYFSPVNDGTFHTLFNYILETIVHPEDRAIYADALDPSVVLKHLENGKHPHFRFDHFRFKLLDGSYRWVEQALITGEEYGFKPGQVGFYIFDIQNAKMRESGHSGNESGMFVKHRDELTGLNRANAFFIIAQAAVKKQPTLDWAVASLDIAHFKLFVEWHGRDNGNVLLAHIGAIIDRFCSLCQGVGGYFGKDDFAFLFPYSEEGIQSLYDEIRAAIASFGLTAGFVPAIGIARLNDFGDIKDALDRASLASSKAKTDIRQRIQTYDPADQKRSEKEFRSMLEFMEALKRGEVTFFLQPQCRISTGKIVGAEALARWVKPDGGIVPPIDFIPALEKYGFIVDLDKHIWESVCLYQNELLSQGIEPIPISVNVSQVDLDLLDIYDIFVSLIERYRLSPKYIKIEITESAYASKAQAVAALVEKLRAKGFVVLMDDFGSGYSSLNMLSSLKIDVIKLDALFLNMGEEEKEKGIHILESVVNMAKSISLPMIVEGIETKEQKHFMEELGVRYAQGFYFYRPMPKEQFASLLAEKDLTDRRGFIAKHNEQFRLREFLDKNIYSDAMLNNILGPVGFYSWDGKNRIDIVRFNEQFYEAVGVPDFAERLDDIQRFMPPDDIPLFSSTLSEAMNNLLSGSEEVLHFYRTDGSLSTFLMKLYYLGDKEGTHRFYGSARDITHLAHLQKQVRTLSRYATETIVLVYEQEGRLSFEVLCHGLEKDWPLTPEQLQRELNDGSFFASYLDETTTESVKGQIRSVIASKAPTSGRLLVHLPNGKDWLLDMKISPAEEDSDKAKAVLTLHLPNE